MILRRYIASNLVNGWLLAVLIVGAVFGLIGFIQELERTQLDYNGWAVARYILMTLPWQLINLAPVIVLLGSMAALSRLRQSNELTIMSCSGFSHIGLIWAVALPTLALMAGLLLAQEYVTPRLQLVAEKQRYNLRYGDQQRLPKGGIWATSGGRYTHLGKMFKGGTPGDIDIFEFDSEGRLLRALHARTAKVGPGRRWLLQGVREKWLLDDTLRTRRHKELELDNLWAIDELPTLTFSMETMPLSVMRRYIHFVAGSDQPTRQYRDRFWQGLLLPLTVGSMVLLAVPISASSGSGRSRGFGVNMAIGAIVGILFYLAAQIIFSLGHLLKLSPPLVAVLPALLVALCAVVLMWRMRW